MKMVSVVVLSYRSADTIIETLDSIKNQTYSNIELIITDDCSLDDSVEIARRWMEDDQGSLSKIKLVTTQQNTGIHEILIEACSRQRWNLPIYKHIVTDVMNMRRRIIKRSIKYF